MEGGGRHDVKDTMPTDPTRTKRERTKKGEKDPPKTKHGPPTGSLILMSFCGVTGTANKLANLPICADEDLNLFRAEACARDRGPKAGMRMRRQARQLGTEPLILASAAARPPSPLLAQPRPQASQKAKSYRAGHDDPPAAPRRRPPGRSSGGRSPTT